MGTNPANAVLRHIRHLVAAQRGGQLSDRELLARFAQQQDEAAFAVLVRRHGAMVLQVGQRILHNRHDPEDVFQATFLTLARLAGVRKWQDSVGNWLYLVASRLALKVRAETVRRSRLELRAVEASHADPLDAASGRELCAALDEELRRLPERCRSPLILCCLEGVTRDEAAARLGWSLATLKRRLERGRALLRQRLTRRGFTLPAVLAAGLFTDQATRAAVSPLLVQAVLRAVGEPAARVLALSQGVIQGMCFSKIKVVVAVVVTVCVFGTGAGWAWHQATAVRPPEEKRVQSPQQAGKEPSSQKAPEEKPLLDRFGDPLPAGAVARLGTVRFRHGGRVPSIAFSPDGGTIASAGDDKTLRFWDTRTGRERGQITGHSSGIRSVAFSPDGKYLVAGDEERFRVWDPATGKQLHPFGTGATAGTFVAFSPNGKLLAAAVRQEGAVVIWDVASGRPVRQLQAKQAFYFGLAFSPDNKTLAAVCADGTIQLWDAAAGQALHTIKGQEKSWLAAAFSPDGKTLVSAGRDKTLHLWDPATGKEIAQLKGHEGPVEVVAYSPDGKTLVSSGYDQTLRVWDAASGKERRTIKGHSTGSTALAFAPQGKLLATADWNGVIHLWDVETGQEQWPYEGNQEAFFDVRFAPDGKTLVSSGHGPFRVWEPITGRELSRFGGDQGLAYAAGLSPDGLTLAAGYGDGLIRLWDVAAGKESRRFKGHERLVRGCVFSADGRRLASVGFDHVVRLWDLASGKELRQMKGQQYTEQVAFAPDGKALATASTDAGGDFTVRLWDAETGKEIWQVTTQPWSAFALAFSPGGCLLALAGGLPGRSNQTGEVRLWEAATGKEVRRCEGYDERVHSVTFSPDGRTLATCGGTWNVIRLWEVATGLERQQFQGHRGFVHGLDFSPEGRLLASGSYDTTALVWDVTGRFRDGRFQPLRLSAKEREDCWADLASADAGKAYRAIQSLAGDESVPFLRERLRPAPTADAKHLTALIRDLDSPEFASREQATKALAALGFRAEAALREAFAAQPTLEMQRRLTALLEKLDPAGSPESLRLLRAVEVLEHLGTTEARAVLTQMAKAAPGTWLEREAKASVERLARRDRRQP